MRSAPRGSQSVTLLGMGPVNGDGTGQCLPCWKPRLKYSLDGNLKTSLISVLCIIVSQFSTSKPLAGLTMSEAIGGDT